MKKLLLLLFFMSCLTTVYGQGRHTIDSLKNLLARAKPDTNKVWLYNSLADQYVWSYPDSGLLYSNPGLALADKLGFDNGRIALLGHRGFALEGRGNFSQALNVGFKQLRLAERMGNAALRAAAMNLIGDIYNDVHDDANALKYFEEARSVAPPAFFKKWEWLYTNGVGIAYLDEGKLDSALYYEDKTYHHTAGYWPPPAIALGKIYEKRGNYQKAFFFAFHGLGVASEKGDQASAYEGLAELYGRTGTPDSAIWCAKKALAICQKTSIKTLVYDAAALLSHIYKEKHIADSALKFEDIMLAANDSLYSRHMDVQMQAVNFGEHQRQQAAIEKETQYRNSVALGVLLLVITTVVVIALIIWRGSKQKQKANLLLSEQKEEIAAQRDNLEQTLGELRSTQAQLIQREKMASLGELTAGIAHEIQNPLNFVNNFSEVTAELTGELKTELINGHSEEVLAIADDIEDNLQKIRHHGKRADFIVKGMLEHSRKSTGEKQPTDINVLCDEFLKLAYHGMRAKQKSFNAEMITHFDNHLPRVNVSQQDIGRVMLNLFNNSFYAVNQKAKTADTYYKPTVEVTTEISGDKLTITVRDNGPGIPENIRGKIMQPFFTTKPTGEGTGLGLSLSYDIIKAHNGDIAITSDETPFTTFTISLPYN